MRSVNIYLWMIFPLWPSRSIIHNFPFVIQMTLLTLKAMKPAFYISNIFSTTWIELKFEEIIKFYSLNRWHLFFVKLCSSGIPAPVFWSESRSHLWCTRTRISCGTHISKVIWGFKWTNILLTSSLVNKHQMEVIKVSSFNLVCKIKYSLRDSFMLK